ncbi:hypothetical protein NB311A_16267 [Nitrobacter sp. Nb-311A]|nr:hypothetical protein NB311A_16267 [Nitrobacter sp. Nb-311A]
MSSKRFATEIGFADCAFDPFLFQIDDVAASGRLRAECLNAASPSSSVIRHAKLTP